MPVVTSRMYSRQEASAIKRKFWTSFGQYMRPVSGAEGDTINWLNYKTGIRDIYFRMEVDRDEATVSIEITHNDPDLRSYFFEQFVQLKSILQETMGEELHWEPHWKDEHGKEISRISQSLKGVNVFNEADWPAIISFFKPRIIALDEFWSMAKMQFEI